MDTSVILKALTTTDHHHIRSPARAPSSPVPCKVYASAARAAEAKSLHGSHFPLAQESIPSIHARPIHCLRHKFYT